MRCYKFQKYRHHEDPCRGWEVCGKCGQKDPDPHMNECEFPHKCANCGGDHPVYARYCESWRENKILSIKYINNIPYYEARKMVVAPIPKQSNREKSNIINMKNLSRH